MGTWSITHWIVVLVIVLLLFGTKKLRNAGGDLGAAIKSFKKGLADGEADGKSNDGQPEKLDSSAAREARSSNSAEKTGQD